VRLESILWAAVTVYFVAVSVLYAAVGGDAGGGVPLGTAALAGGLVAGWSWRWRWRYGVRGADRTDADANEEPGIVGVYTTASLRPLGLATGMVAIALGVPVGDWMVLAGLAIVASQVALMVRDADP
jgi:hypothetical protein